MNRCHHVTTRLVISINGKIVDLVKQDFSVERRRVVPEGVVPDGAAEDEVEGVMRALQLRGDVQHVLVRRQRHRQRVARHDAVQRELGALRLACHADLDDHIITIYFYLL